MGTGVVVQCLALYRWALLKQGFVLSLNSFHEQGDKGKVEKKVTVGSSRFAWPKLVVPYSNENATALTSFASVTERDWYSHKLAQGAPLDLHMPLAWTTKKVFSQARQHVDTHVHLTCHSE